MICSLAFEITSYCKHTYQNLTRIISILVFGLVGRKREHMEKCIWAMLNSILNEINKSKYEIDGYGHNTGSKYMKINTHMCVCYLLHRTKS